MDEKFTWYDWAVAAFLIAVFIPLDSMANRYMTEHYGWLGSMASMVAVWVAGFTVALFLWRGLPRLFARL